MSATIKLRHNVIFGGKYYAAGEPIERSILPWAMRKYEVKEEEEKPSSRREINLRREYNKLYLVDAEGNMSFLLRQQAAQMQAEAEYNDYINNEGANPPLSPDTQAALDEAQDLYRRDLEAKKLQMKVAAENADAISDAIRAEQDQAVAEGAFDQMDTDDALPPAKVEPRPARVTKLFANRGTKYLPVHEVDDLEQGEPLYRYRPRSLGQTAMYIKHGTVKCVFDVSSG
jgi:hypothetical protein